MSEPAKSEPANSEPACLSDVSRYERACDEAIAMCDGNMRSTIKALIMANEYLEAELQELQAATSHHGNGRCRLIERTGATQPGAAPWPM
jgi:hypothetical protein